MNTGALTRNAKAWPFPVRKYTSGARMSDDKGSRHWVGIYDAEGDWLCDVPSQDQADTLLSHLNR